jgi:hydroxypyruvate isomerase
MKDNIMALQHNDKLSRRTFIRRSTLAAAGAVAGSLARAGTAGPAADVERIVKKDRIHQSVCKWCYSHLSLEELCVIAKKMGLNAIDLLVPKDFPTLTKHGLICSMISTHGLTKGLNHKENHAECLAKIHSAIEAAAEYHFPNVVIGLKKIVGYAEKKRVTICFEYLNSKVNHKDYMFDHMAWGVEVCKRVGSERVKILYDIYHAQIMEGDIIRTLRDNRQYIGHYHTGGNPGRHEIDDTQELYYPAIMRAIAEKPFADYVAHEFIPKGDPVKALAYAVRICDV